MIEDLTFTSTRPLSNEKSLKRYFNKRTIETALEQQKHLRGGGSDCSIGSRSDIYTACSTMDSTINSEGREILTYSQDECLKELGDRRNDRLDRGQDQYFPLLNNEHNENNNRKEELCSEEDKKRIQPIQELQDVSNVETKNRSGIDYNSILDDAASLFFYLDENQDVLVNERYDEYNQHHNNECDEEWDHLEIVPSKTFDEDEMIDLLELEIKPSMAFDEDEGPYWSIEEEGFPSRFHHDDFISQGKYP